MSDPDSQENATCYSSDQDLSLWRTHSSRMLAPKDLAFIHHQFFLCFFVFFSLDANLTPVTRDYKVRAAGLAAARNYIVQGRAGEQEIVHIVILLLKRKVTRASNELLDLLLMPCLHEYMRTCALVLLCRIGIQDDWTLRQHLRKGGLSIASFSLLHEHWAETALYEERFEESRGPVGGLLLVADEVNKPLQYMFMMIALAMAGDKEEARIALDEVLKRCHLAPVGWTDAIGARLLLV